MSAWVHDWVRVDNSDRIGMFAILTWLHMMVVTHAFYHSATPEFSRELLAAAFHLAVWAIYSLIYLLPGIILLVVASRWLRDLPKSVAALAVISTSLCVLFIRVDAVIYDLYNFHFNAFVLNLLLTPGGIQSLGGGSDTYWSLAAIAGGHVLVQTLCWPLSRWMADKSPFRVRKGVVLLALALAMLGERTAYGLADIRNDGEILNAAKVYPLYGRTKFRTLAAKFGVEPAPREAQLAIETGNGRLNYPIGAIPFASVENPPNVVLLVAESLRWDRLTPEIMPNTWRLARQGQYFTRHYSSGNGTREGLFGLFYGLYGSYWSSFLYAQRSPLLMDRFQELNYQFDLRTSAKFSYPEFDRTLFAGMPAAALHESSHDKAPWEMDRDNTTALIEFLRKRDTQRPFMSFFFLESTHARYSFPESAVVAKPYLESVNYASMSRESLIPKIDQLLNRYSNSAHWVDMQLGRIYEELERQDLLRNTIVIVTGDHGEEFMEKGAWGHNSSFVEEQIRTPLVIWMPGREHREIGDISSHLDIGTTLLQVLGAPKDTAGYSLGRNLFEPAARPFIVSSDWHSISVITDDMKYRIPYTNQGTDHWLPTDLSDNPYPSSEVSGLLQKNNPIVLESMGNCSKFMANAKMRRDRKG